MTSMANYTLIWAFNANRIAFRDDRQRQMEMYKSPQTVDPCILWNKVQRCAVNCVADGMGLYGKVGAEFSRFHWKTFLIAGVFSFAIRWENILFNPLLRIVASIK